MFQKIIRARWLFHVSALMAYVGLAVVLTWPLILWPQHILGGPHILYDDTSINVWNM